MADFMSLDNDANARGIDHRSSGDGTGFLEQQHPVERRLEGAVLNVRKEPQQFSRLGHEAILSVKCHDLTMKLAGSCRKINEQAGLGKK